MKLLNIAKVTFFRRLRDKQELLTNIFLPLLLIFILGTALQGNFGVSELGDIPTAYLNEDKGPGGEAFEEFLEEEEIKQWLHVIPVDSYDQGLALIDQREALTFIYLPENFSEGIASGGGGTIEIRDAGLSQLLPSVVNNIVESYTQGGNLMLALMDMERTALKETSVENSRFFTEKIRVGGEDNVQKPLILRNTLDGGEKQISGMDYYAVTMLVMFIMWGIFTGAQSLTEDLFTPLKTRIYMAPVGKLSYFLGKTIGVLGTFIFQILVIIFFTKWVYGVGWGETLWPILGISVVLSLVAIAIGIAIALSAPSESGSAAIINGFVVISTFVAGGFFPIEMESSLFRIIRSLSPNYHAQQGIFNVVYNGSTAAIGESILSLLAISAGVLLMAFYQGRRKTHEDL
ncbi:ABC transporter permease [Isachenkonia alkalipeptolytica]|uniref:ABC transporter permease n=1 Tax=Isachenkonia alkalipeptolytica TaxID=2565777 RepID=A0AA43XIN9_9CLOT|nr:ABC transporter permease [Isachenkonia alkalipeptolytica]NBG86919.1 ABC transporter permease [Isachenkonia alkalipeptolytica]